MLQLLTSWMFWGLVHASYQPCKNGIVYLADEPHVQRNRATCPSMYDSLHSLDAHMPPANHTCVIVLHENSFDIRTASRLRQASPYPLFFRRIRLEGPANVTSYHKMCRFWAYDIFKLPGMPKYLMRMDTDGCLKSRMPVNPFQYMASHHLYYMWKEKFVDAHEVVQGLNQWTLQTLGPSVALDDAVPLVYSTNMEWMYLPAFQTRDMLQWINDSLWGVWTYRWGDAPLRTVSVPAFFPSWRVTHFCNYSYGHSVWDVMQPCV